MSRHSVSSGDKEFVYGFDYPLCHYFYEVYESGDDEKDIIEQSDLFSGCSRGELLEAIENHGVEELIPGSHTSAIALDLPIPD